MGENAIYPRREILSLNSHKSRIISFVNPILSREIRGRFRDKRSFWLLFGVSALLALAATFIYANAIGLGDAAGAYNPGRLGVARAENRTGRELFRFLALGNTLAWLLIAPALTATGLAKERERGLLESLWLSPFRVAAQVWGRLGAALCFLLALQVAALPVYGIALLLGGVSPAEIGLAGLIIALTALIGATFGLFCSARSYRGSSALGAAFFGVAAWSAAAFWGFSDLRWAATPLNFSLTFTHPVSLLWILLSPDDFLPRYGNFAPPFVVGGPAITTTITRPISTADALTFGLIFQLLLSGLLMWSAVRKAAKPLPDMRWSQGNERLNRARAALEAARDERKKRREAARTRDAVAGALLYEVPVEKFVRFKNPLLSREVRGRFRLRQSGWFVSLLRYLTLVVAVCFWLGIVYNSLDPVTQVSGGQSLMLGILGFGTLAIGVMSSTALVREREAGTWEGLHLSLLAPREIVRSKWLSPLITFGYWSVPFWILLPLTFGTETLGALLIVVASLCSVSAWGLFISSRAPHSAAATSWTLASLLVGLVALPALDSILEIGQNVARGFFNIEPYSYSSGGDQVGWSSFEPLWNAYHPFLAIGNLFSKFQFQLNDNIKAEIVALSLVLNALFVAILLGIVRRRLQKTAG